MSRPLPVLLILLAVAILVLVFTRGATNPVAPLPPPPQADPTLQFRFRSVELRGRKEGKPSWVARAKEATVTRDQEEVRLKGGPNGEIYNIKDWKGKDEKNPDPAPAQEKLHTVTWRANEAHFKFASEDLKLIGKVTVKTDEDDVVTTGELRWKGKEKKVYCPKPTKVLGHDGTKLQSDKLKADTELEVIELFGNVRFEGTVKETEKL